MDNVENILTHIYVYDRIKRSVMKCTVTPESQGSCWYDFIYDGKKCAYEDREGRCSLQTLYVTGCNPAEDTILVSKSYGTIRTIFMSDSAAFSEIANTYARGFREVAGKRWDIDKNEYFKIIEQNDENTISK